MRRSTAVTAVVAAVVTGLILVWNTIGQDRAFRALLRQGEAALASGDTSAAAAAFSGALAIQPDSTVARLKRGDTYHRRGELQAALADLTAAAALDPSAPRVQELLGDVHLDLGQPSRAVDAYRACLALDERAPLVLIKLSGAELTDGQTAHALASARKALTLDARLAEAHYLEGVALRPTDPAQAARALEQAIALKPALIPAREQLAAVLLAIGRVKEGAEALDAIAALEPGNPGRAAAVVVAYSAAGKYDSAMRRLERAEEQFPGEVLLTAAHGQVLLDRAEAEQDRQLRADAEATLAPLAARDHPASAVLAAMGRARLLAGDARGAVTWLERATAELPVDPAALRLLARAASDAGDEHHAMVALIRHEALDPGSAWAVAHTRRILAAALKLGDLQTADTWAARAERTAPDDDEVAALVDAVRRRTGQNVHPPAASGPSAAKPARES